MVYVISKDGHPLMPTQNHAKVRILLRNQKATVIKRCPFTIRLCYDSTEYTQEITLGVDAGSKTIGLSASTEAREYYSSEVILRTDIVELLATRRESRRSRRGRKTRYRKARFENRIHSKNKGWLAPSVEQRIGCHLTSMEKVRKILPVKKIVIETASFDTQKLKDDSIRGYEYQEGDMLGFWNVREYVLWRDGHQCQCCHGKSKDKVLNVHHIESRKTGGNSPQNLITMCEYCHKQYHRGNVALNIRRGTSYRDAAFMGIMRWAVYNRLKKAYIPENIEVRMTYGYLTKNTRIQHGLPKEHCVDALCIAGHPEATRSKECFIQKKIRCHNRQIHKANLLKGGSKKLNQAPYEVKGFRLFDKVLFQGKECFIFGRRSTGYFDIRRIDGARVHASASCKKMQLLEKRKNYIIERKQQVA